MSLQAILDACVAVVSGVSGAGLVRDYEALAPDETSLNTQFVSGGIINTVEIVRRTTPARYFANAKAQFDHQILHNFYRGLLDPSVSGPAHTAFVDAVVEAYRDNYRLGGVARRVDIMQIEFSGHVEKGGLLLHYASGILLVQEDRQD